MRPRRAQAATATKRFVAFCTHNGVVRADWTFERNLAPLADPRLYKYVTKVDGVSSMGRREKNGNHHEAACTMLTGWHMGTGVPSATANGPVIEGWALGPSIDIAIGAEYQKRRTVPRPSIQLGTMGPNDIWRTFPGFYYTFKGPDEPAPPYYDPVIAFQKLFGNGVPSGMDATKFYARRQTVLDGIERQFARLRARLGAEDRRRLDEHLTFVREVENQLAAQVKSSATKTGMCAPPTPPVKTTALDQINRTHRDLIVLAFTCDLVHAASLQVMRSGSYESHPWVSVPELYHDAIAHAATPSRPDIVARKSRVERWWVDEFADLLLKMQRTPDPLGAPGSLLDNSVVFWGNEIADGATHVQANTPYIVAGGAGGKLRGGKTVTLSLPHNNNLLVSLLHLMDIDAPTFGNPEWCSGNVDAGLTG
jgi:hypothetical protein